MTALIDLRDPIRLACTRLAPSPGGPAATAGVRRVADPADLAVAGRSEAELALYANAVADVDRMREGIAGILALLRDLDRLLPGAPATARLDEVAALFSDIADFAAYGTRKVRHAADALRKAGAGTRS